MSFTRPTPFRPSNAAAAALAAFVVGLVALRVGLVFRSTGSTGGADVARLVLLYATLPRLVVALLGGAMLALAGALFQHALDNPLAASSTLGVTAGAQLAIVLATLLAPSLVGAHGFVVAALGSMVAASIVLAVALRAGGTGTGIVLVGLAVGLFCISAASALQLADQEDLGSTRLWKAGALDQTDWSAATALWPPLAIAGLFVAAIIRPLALLGLDEASTRGLGLDPRLVRAAALVLGALLAASVTAAVGPIAFVEFAAPILSRSLGVRRLPTHLLASPLIGAALLLAVDQAAAAIQAMGWGSIPTGAVTGLLAAPLVLAMLPRLRRRIEAGHRDATSRLTSRIAPALAVLALGLAVVTLWTIAIGRDGTGWALLTPTNVAELLPWRGPRTLAAIASGALLAEAGAVLQRNTGNPMASPEVLGLGAAALGGFLVVLFIDPTASRATLVAGGTFGALAHFALLAWRGAKSRFSGEQIVLAGLVLGTAINAVATVVLSLGDARGPALMAWIAGTTTTVDGTGAALTLAIAVPLAAGMLAFARPLDLLPLGDVTAGALGLAVGRARFVTTLAAALMTALAVLVAGPMAFVGLIGPHLARRLGFGRAASHLTASALLGALIMVLADWTGRTVAAPFEIPAGLTASLIGVPYLLALALRRQPGGVS